MNRPQLVLTLCATFVLGCATASAVSSATAVAAQDPDPTRFNECFAANLFITTGGSMTADYVPKKTVQIPRGWTPIGGGGPVNGTTLVLCR